MMPMVMIYAEHLAMVLIECEDVQHMRVLLHLLRSKMLAYASDSIPTLALLHHLLAQIGTSMLGTLSQDREPFS